MPAKGPFILEYMHPRRLYTNEQIAKGIGEEDKLSSVNSTLSNMVFRGQLTRVDRGVYRLNDPDPVIERLLPPAPAVPARAVIVDWDDEDEDDEIEDDEDDSLPPPSIRQRNLRSGVHKGAVLEIVAPLRNSGWLADGSNGWLYRCFPITRIRS